MAHEGRRNADEAILLALACGATGEAAARTAGVAERTVRRRLADPAFKARLASLRSDMVQRASGSLTAASQQAVQTLMVLQKEGSPPAVRLGAARAGADDTDLGVEPGSSGRARRRGGSNGDGRLR